MKNQPNLFCTDCESEFQITIVESGGGRPTICPFCGADSLEERVAGLDFDESKLEDYDESDFDNDYDN